MHLPYLELESPACKEEGRLMHSSSLLRTLYIYLYLDAPKWPRDFRQMSLSRRARVARMESARQKVRTLNPQLLTGVLFRTWESTESECSLPSW
jgi:hypothetical protein